MILSGNNFRMGNNATTDVMGTMSTSKSTTLTHSFSVHNCLFFHFTPDDKYILYCNKDGLCDRESKVQDN